MNCYFSAERSFKKKKQIKSLQTYRSNSIHISGETFFGKQLVALRLARKNLERRTRVRAEANRELALGITYLYFRFNYPRSSFQTRVKRTISSFVVTCRETAEPPHPPGIDNLIGLFFLFVWSGRGIDQVRKEEEERRGEWETVWITRRRRTNVTRIRQRHTDSDIADLLDGCLVNFRLFFVNWTSLPPSSYPLRWIPTKLHARFVRSFVACGW